MKKVIFLYISIVLTIAISCKKEKVYKTEFSINEFKFLTHNSVIVFAEVSGTESPFDVWNKGICYAEHSNPTLNDSVVKNLPNVGEFNVPISGLKPNTTYFVKVYAETTNGVFYSKEQSFKTLDVAYFVDPRDGQKYPIITIGNQTWFASNLNYQTDEGSYYFHNDSSTYASDLGKLYTYEAALEACPDGWHLPSDKEWKNLEMELGMSQASADSLAWRGESTGNKMKEPGSRLWYDNDGLATNESGLTIKPGGTYYIDTKEYSVPGRVTMFWSSTSYSDMIYFRFIQFLNGKVQRYYIGKDNIAISIRCVKD
jgi:uncharacterized protein (TIGR02145 family)